MVDQELTIIRSQTDPEQTHVQQTYKANPDFRSRPLTEKWINVSTCIFEYSRGRLTDGKKRDGSASHFRE